MIAELRDNKVICAVKGEDSLHEAIYSKSKVIFILSANINTVVEQVERCHKAGKVVYLHFDLAEGFEKDEAAVQYCARTVKPDGILTTRNHLVKAAQENGMKAILRIFLIDSRSMLTAVTSVQKQQPDAVEIMPGIAYQAIKEMKKRLPEDTQIIAGGFIRTEEDCRNAFNSGAEACSTSNYSLW